MLADLDLLLTAVFCTADDLLPERRKNARRSLTDAEVATLCVAQAVMGIASDREFLAVARSRLAPPVPKLPKQPGYRKRRLRLAETIEWLIGDLRRRLPRLLRPRGAAGLHPGRVRPLGRDRQAFRARARLRASATAAAIPAGSGGCACTCSPPRTAPREQRSSPQPTRKNATSRCDCSQRGLHGGEPIVADKGYAGRDFEAARRAALRRDDPAPGPQRRTRTTDRRLSRIRQRIESIFWTLKDRLGLERHRARTLHGLSARIATKLLALAAGVWLNHYLDQPTRSFAALAA